MKRLAFSSLPPDPVELAHAGARHDHALRDEQRSLEHLAAAVAAEPSPGGYHAVARHIGTAAALHDVADGARGARPAGERGDVAVSRDAPGRDPPHDGEHAKLKGVAELFHRPRLT